MYYEDLNNIFDKFDLCQEARAEIRHVFAVMLRDSERSAFSQGWNEGQALCDRER
jgi:hypothetical protein